MREIKFRGKRVDNGEWVYGYFAVDTDTKTNYIIERIYWNCEECSDQTLYCEVDPSTVGQYTGLKDKNGKEIYEGDIVTAWSQGSKGTFEIRWREDGGGSLMYILYPAWQNGEMWHIAASRESEGLVYDRGLEAIGNIYDNPELLKE